MKKKEETSGWDCMGKQSISDHDNVIFLQEHLRSDSATHYSPWGNHRAPLSLYIPVFLPAKKLATVLLPCSVLFTPQRAKGQPRYRPWVVPTGASWRHSAEESLAHPGHKHSSFMGLASCRTCLMSPEQTRAPLSFLPSLLPGSEWNQEQGENALKTKIKKYREQ